MAVKENVYSLYSNMGFWLMLFIPMAIAFIYLFWLIIFFGLPISHRKTLSLHARYMVAASLTFLDRILIFWLDEFCLSPDNLNPIHTIWIEKGNDFGESILKKHRIEHKH
jgi:hypothetical protein